jgi:hypothetical protein
MFSKIRGTSLIHVRVFVTALSFVVVGLAGSAGTHWS